MASKAVSELFRMVKVRGRLKGDYAKISAHSMRKFFYTKMDLREDYLRWIQGKATSVYLDDPDDVTRQYIQKYDGIRVFGLDTSKAELNEVETTFTKKVNDLMQQVNELTHALEKSEKESQRRYEQLLEASRRNRDLKTQFEVRQTKLEKQVQQLFDDKKKNVEMISSARDPALFFETVIEGKDKEYERRREEGTDWDSFISKNPEVKKLLFELLKKSDKPRS